MHVSDGVFNTYVILLAIAGVVMLVMACLPLPQGKVSRIIGGLLGLGFLGYAIYLKFIFDGGSFELFYYVFILPFIYIARVAKAYAARRNQSAAGLVPPTYPQPGYGQGYIPGPAQPGPSAYGPPPTPAPNSYGPPPTSAAPQPGSMPPPPPTA